MKLLTLLRTHRRTVVWAGTCLLWTVRAALVTPYYQRKDALGYYTAASDSIGIPIFGEWIATAVLLPVVFIALWLLLDDRPADYGYSWAMWNKARWGWSGAITLLFAALFAFTTTLLVENIRLGLPFNAAANIGWLAVWLELRAVAVSKLNQ